MQRSVNHQLTTREQFYVPLIVFIAVLSYVRLLFLNDVFWDDHCWLQSVFTSNNLAEFLNTGFVELRRVPQGIVLYLVYLIFKISDHAFIIIHLIIITTQIITAVFLYLLIYELFKNRIAAFIIGSILIIYPIDTTIPIISPLIYRLGLMFSIVSFYITVRALSNKIKWFYLIIALMLSGISNYFLVEGTNALEPARLCIIGIILHNKGYKINDVLKYSFIYWLPFLLLCIPIVLYKLLYKPYGLYAADYKTDWLFFLRVSLHLRYLAMLLGYNWVFLLGKTAYLSLWSVIGGLVAFITTYVLLEKNYADESGFQEIEHLFINLNLESGPTRIKMVFWLGLLLLLPVVSTYEYAWRVIASGVASRNGCITQFGHALIVGGLICVVFNKLFVDYKYKKQFIALSMAILFGLGVFFNNWNLDLYFNVWNQEKKFYQAFMERFHALPKKADFMFDVQMGTKDYIGLGQKYHSYHAEFPINMLYAESYKPENFRSHKVTCWCLLNTYTKIGPTQYEFLYHWGKDIYDTRDLIVIRWQPGEFLVNREIVEKYPQIGYKTLADKDIPPIPAAPTYPLREKMNPFLGK
jgi:hypothetical protein